MQRTRRIQWRDVYAEHLAVLSWSASIPSTCRCTAARTWSSLVSATYPLLPVTNSGLRRHRRRFTIALARVQHLNNGRGPRSGQGPHSRLAVSKATPPIMDEDASIQSGWPIKILRVARPASELTQPRGRFSEEIEEEEPSAG
jgi:hypothetical protein